MIFAVLENRYHHIVFTHSFKLVSFFYIYQWYVRSLRRNSNVRILHPLQHFSGFQAQIH